MAKVIDKLAWTPLHNKEVLFARTRGQELFYCTGGKRKERESDEQALAREVQEETGAILIPETIKHVFTFDGPAHGAGEGVRMTMRCYNADYTGTIEPKNEIEELAWFTSADMSRTTEMGGTILAWFKEQNLIN